MKRKKYFNRFCISFILLFIIYILVGLLNNPLTLTNYTITHNDIPKSFDGYKILQLSDLHSKNFGNNQGNLIEMIKSSSPDIIVLTGDNIDRSDTDLTNIENLFAGINELCPIFAISGNHEAATVEMTKKLKLLYEEYNIYDLDDDSYDLTIGKDKIRIHGLGYQTNFWTDNSYVSSENEFSILLYHDATQFTSVAYFLKDNLIISGHTHGGIIRLPFIGGLFNNDLSLFASYDNGLYYTDNAVLVSSRGLGDSFLPRFNNPPEVVCITLKSSN